MGKYIIDLPDDDGFTPYKRGYAVKIKDSVLINASIDMFRKITPDEAKQIDKRFEPDYIRRWRVLAMLRNIRNEIESGEDVAVTINNYIRFVEKLDEKKWEEEFCAEMYGDL